MGRTQRSLVVKRAPLNHTRRHLRREPRVERRAVARVVLGPAPDEPGRHGVAPALARREVEDGARGRGQREGQREAQWQAHFAFRTGLLRGRRVF